MVEKKYMRFKIYPYKQSSVAAKRLARSLNVLRVRPTYDPKRRDVIINWGNSYNPHWLEAEHDLNKPEAIHVACNKLTTFRALQASGYEHLPDWTTDIDVARNWITEGCKVMCRTLLTSHSGRGIIVADTVDQLVTAPLYTKHARHRDEYRIHVFKGSVIDQTQKRRRISTGARTDVRNHDNGWVFCRTNVNAPDALLSSAVNAVSKLGLDFGAVDIGYRYRDEKPILFEVNTAPGIEGTTLIKYTQAFNLSLIHI